ncbi:MAG TPA: CPCC family cysteine-rich protein [Polyangium sp.]|nr:CPCC family cysteine-rich protein [Polyangium sp.]
MITETLFECPCCKLRTLTERKHYEICSICNWEDDPLQEERTDYAGGANTVSLNEARRNFMKHGTIDPRAPS